MPRPKSALPTTALQVRFPTEDLEWLRVYALKNERTIAQELRHMVNQKRKREERK